MDDKNIYHYVVAQSKLNPKSVTASNLKIEEDQRIRRIWIIGHCDEQQDSTIVVFYATIPSVVTEDTQHPPMKLKIK